jgi:hypothetical protein
VDTLERQQKQHPEKDKMAAHVKRIIYNALRQIVEDTANKPNDRCKAARLLHKLRYSAPKGKPRGRFAKKAHIASLEDILRAVNPG